MIMLSTFAVFLLFAQFDDPAYHIRIQSGSINRVNSIVSFSVPTEIAAGAYVARTTSGDVVPLQVDAFSRAWILLRNLNANSTMDLILNMVSDSSIVSFIAESIEYDRTIALNSNGREVLRFFHRENEPPDSLGPVYRRGGYIHPVRTPSGTVLTGHLNGPYHIHHSGIWSAWTNTIFQGRKPDFWNAQLLGGRVDIDTLISTWSGPVQAGFESVNRFTDLTSGVPITALREHWEVRSYAIPPEAGFHMFDVVLTQTVSEDAPLLLPEYLYGGVGFRGHSDWDDTTTTRVLTSEGLGRFEANTSRAKWLHIGGFTGGKQGGVAILGHPSNFRFPQPMRIHPTAPFFNFAPTQSGEMSIQPGRPYVVRYRYITYDGEPDVAMIEQMWNDYANPPSVSVERR